MSTRKNRIYFSPRPEDGRRIEMLDLHGADAVRGRRAGPWLRGLMLLALAGLCGGVALVGMPAEEEEAGRGPTPPSERLETLDLELLEQLPVSWSALDRERLPKLLAAAPTRFRYDLMLVMEQEEHPLVRAAILAAATLGDRQFLPAIQRLTAAEEPRTRAYAIEARDRFQRWEPQELEALIATGEAGALAGVIATVGRREPPERADVIVRGLVHPSDLVRRCALSLLPRRLRDEGIAAFEQIAQSGTDEERVQLLRSLDGVDVRQPLASAVLRMLGGASEAVRWQVVTFVKDRVRPLEEPAAIVAIATDSEGRHGVAERVHALDCLEATQAMVAGPQLYAASADANPFVAYRAARLLVLQGEAKGVETLLRLHETPIAELGALPQPMVRMLKSEVQACLETVSERTSAQTGDSWTAWWQEQEGKLRVRRLPPSWLQLPPGS